MNGKSFVYVFAVLCAVIGGGVFVATQLAAPPVDKEELIKEVLAGEDLTAMANPFEKPANGPFGKAEISETSFDFGEMALGAKQSHDFVIKNIGDGPLQLAKGPSTCKCTMSKLATNSLAPGESTVIELEWEPKEANEEFSQQATIWTDDPSLFSEDDKSNGGIVLVASGAVLPSLFLTPDYVSLGTISDNDPTKFSAAVASKIFDDAAPVLDGTPAAFIDVETLPLSKEELAEVNGLSGIRVNVTIKPEMPLGDFSEKIWFSTPKVPGYRMSLEISGRRQGPFLFVGEDWHDKSSTIRLGDFPAKKGKKVRISIFSAEKDGPLTLEVAEQDPAEMIVKIHQREGDVNDGQVQHYVDVEIPAGLPPARRVYEKGGYIVIKTSHPQVPTMKLRVSYISGT